jgi:uncharacterized protein
MLLPINKNGFVINQGNINKIQPEYKIVLDEIIKKVINQFGENVISMYVRGSVSVGRAIKNISDIDFIVITKDKLSEADVQWQINQIDYIEKQYPYLSIMDLTIITKDDLLSSNEYKNLSIYLKTQSACLYGEDIVSRLPEVKPSRELALKMYSGLDKEIKRLRSIFSGEIKEPTYLNKVRPFEFWCIWLSRVLLRSGLGLVMIKTPVYTQDLKDCYRLFSQEYTEHAKEMEQALAWAVNPTNDTEKIIKYIDSFIPKILKIWEEIKKEKI